MYNFNCITIINATLTKLNLSSNRITDEGAKRLAKAIQVNTTLQELNVSKNWISKEGVMRIAKACKADRKLHKLVCTHNNLSKSGLAVINEYIKKENAVQIFEASWNSIIASKDRLYLFIITCQSLRWSRLSSSDDDCKTVWLFDNIVWENIPCKFMHGSLTELNFSHYNIATT